MEERIISVPNVAIVTDSVADLSPQVAERSSGLSWFRLLSALALTSTAMVST